MKGERLGDGEILLIIDASKAYSCHGEWNSDKKVARLLENKF